MESSKNNKKIIIALIIFITALIIVNFIFSNTKYEITFEIIICLSLLVILALSEMFDNLSIPKVISLSKNVKEVKKENEDLKDANIKLLEQITNIKNSNSQNIFLPNSFSTISSSNIDDINKNVDNLESGDFETKFVNKDYKVPASERYKYRRNLEIFMLKKALDTDNNISSYDIQYDIKLINNKLVDDNIMKNEARFDALKSNLNENIFYEVKITPFMLDFPYQLHYMLRTLELYREFTKIPCKLVLVLPKFEGELEKILFNMNSDRFTIMKEKMSNRFEINVSKEELDKYIKAKEEKNNS